MGTSETICPVLFFYEGARGYLVSVGDAENVGAAGKVGDVEGFVGRALAGKDDSAALVKDVVADVGGTLWNGCAQC